MLRIIEAFKRTNLLLRLISASFLIPLVAWICVLGGDAFTTSVIVLSILMAFEWQSVISNAHGHYGKWRLVGIVYIAVFALSLLYIRNQENGLWFLIYLLVVIWSTDTGAYICGIVLGGPKLAPQISPAKSWSGFVGGVLVSIAAVHLFIKTIEFDLFRDKTILMTVLVSVLGQIGDLVESSWKRIFKVKDSGNIIPGHGGVLDRMDSMVFATSFLVLMMLLRIV